MLAEEIAQAAQYVQSLLPAEAGPATVTIDWQFVPSTQLGGDMFGYHWLDPDHLALYLLDVSGHGVGSSLLAVSAANVLSAQSLPDTDFRDPGQVLTRLNDVFQMEKQDNKYFTIWYGVYHKPDARRLRYAKAGHPPALAAGSDGQPPQDSASDGPVVGMMPDMPFPGTQTTCRRAAGCWSTATASSRSSGRTGRCGSSRSSWRM